MDDFFEFRNYKHLQINLNPLATIRWKKIKVLPADFSTYKKLILLNFFVYKDV